MKIFIDESGDCGMKVTSAAHYALAAVIVETDADAHACEQAMAEVRKKLGRPQHFEFHFARISPVERAAFLEAIAPCPFTFAARLLRKKDLTDPAPWHDKGHLYRQVIAGLVEDVQEMLSIARACKGKPLEGKVTADDNRDAVYFRVLRELFKLPKDANGRSLIAKVRPGRSGTSSLLQLADMVCGAVVHAPESDGYRKRIKSREISVVDMP